MHTIDKARRCFEIIMERKAVNPILLKIKDMSSIADYFLIASGSSTRQVQAIVQHTQRRMREKGSRPYSIEGAQEGHWAVMDYGFLIVHIFYQPYREFYDLEGLWIEAPQIHISSTTDRETGICC